MSAIFTHIIHFFVNFLIYKFPFILRLNLLYYRISKTTVKINNQGVKSIILIDLRRKKEGYTLSAAFDYLLGIRS